jgi:hypothetical protein
MKTRRGSILASLLAMLVMSGIILGVAFFFREVLRVMRVSGNETKKEQFLKGELFRCHVQDFSSKRLLLSKEDGWEIYKDEFKKDNTLIPISGCEVEEK